MNQKLTLRKGIVFGAIYSNESTFGCTMTEIFVYLFPCAHPSPSLPATTISSKDLKKVMSMSLLDHKVDDLAKQLTLLEMEMYKRIEIHEMFVEKWAKSENPSVTAPNLITVYFILLMCLFFFLSLN